MINNESPIWTAHSETDHAATAIASTVRGFKPTCGSAEKAMVW